MIVKAMAVYIWPPDNQEVKTRVVTAMGLLVAAKVLRIVLDPYTSNLDPDPEFWPDMDQGLGLEFYFPEFWPDMDQGLGLKFYFKLKNIFKIFKEKFKNNNLFLKPEIFFSQLSLGMVNFCLIPLSSNLSYFYLCGCGWVRIQNTDLDPQSC